MVYLSCRSYTTKTKNVFVHLISKPLSRYQFNAVLQKAINSGAISGDFRTHSFRIGRATDIAFRVHLTQTSRCSVDGSQKHFLITSAFFKLAALDGGNSRISNILLSSLLYGTILFSQSIAGLSIRFFRSSVPYWAGQTARPSSEGDNLNLPATILWRAKRGMHWNQLDPEILQFIQRLAPSNYIIQLGSNDLVTPS